MHWALAFAGLAGLLALVVLIWNQRLRRQLRSRRAEVIDLEARSRVALARAQESRQRFEDLIEQSPAVFELYDTNGVLVQVNSAFEKLWQLPRSDVVGKFNVFKSQQVADLGFLPYFERAFAGERTKAPDVEFDASREEVAKGRSRKRWISSLVYPIRDAAGIVTHMAMIHEDITAQKEAEERLRAYQERLRALAGELTATEERERRRIATALHDGAAQSLAFARMQLAAVSKMLTDPAAAAKLDELSTLLKQSLQQVREILLDLSSPALDELGLGAALAEWLGQQVGERHGLETAFEDASGDLQLTEDARALLFRNARELMTNAVKHAKARKVTLSMDRRAGALRIRVQDDGNGFDPRELARRPGGESAFGLFSIRERMADLGGSLEIVSRSDAGTEATLIAPLDRLT